MKMKLVLVENDETLCTELKELLAFYNAFDIVKTFEDPALKRYEKSGLSRLFQE